MHRNKLSPLANYGINLFDLEQMHEHLPREFYEKLTFAIRNQRPIASETADVIAQAMKEWALSHGATHYTHWFQPLTGLTAEKHDSFLTLDGSGRPLERFSGKELIVSEPDASSFPHGGLRSTFEARGYAAWDPTSPAFLIRRGGSVTLALPSVFVSYKGDVLDKKTPLLRSIHAVNKASVRMMRLLGNKRITSVTPSVGAEQEYFLVDLELVSKRPDLSLLGTTLIGAEPSRGQLLEDHYFGSMNERVVAYMEEVEQELIQLGVPVKTRHNEVAPGQFELACIHQPANIAADQNQLVMEVLRRIAPHHGFVALLHEKPYARVNGSGKHNNWSLIDSEGTNLLEPGTKTSSQLRFLIFLMATVWGVERHGALLSAIAASPGNDRRLGGSEAPPRITSVHLGIYLTELVNSVAKSAIRSQEDLEEIDLGLGGVAKLPKDTTDRNRTSPFAFTGNKFEFRALGSSGAISLPNAVINTMVAQSLDAMSDRLSALIENGQQRSTAALQVLREIINEAQQCRYDGDCYTTEWAEEAERRGLSIPMHTPDSLKALVLDSTVEMFESYGILTRAEIEARYRIRLDQYSKTIAVEARVTHQLLTGHVLPAALRYQKMVAGSIKSLEVALISPDDEAVLPQREHLKRIAQLNASLLKHIATLEKNETKLENIHDYEELAEFCAVTIRPNLDAAREIADELELHVDASLWTLPRYDDLLKIN